MQAEKRGSSWDASKLLKLPRLLGKNYPDGLKNCPNCPKYP
jgi:hypothetical protein